MEDDVTIGLKHHTINFEKKTHESNYKTPLLEKFDHISNRTVRRISHNKVLVHCQMGRSRSATLVIMYMLYKTLVDKKEIDCTAEEMTKYVQSRRSVVDPNKGFMQQIINFEELVRNGTMEKRVLEKKGKKDIGGTSIYKTENYQTSPH